MHPLGVRDMFYVLAYDDNGYVCDVTRRYAQNFSSQRPSHRVPADWWTKTLDPLRASASDDARVEREERALEAVEAQRALPTTLGAYKTHSTFTLERHLNQLEAIYPRGPVAGYVRGEPIFPRENIQALKTRENWLRLGREPLPNTPPYKEVKSRSQREGAPEKVGVWGEWQTRIFVAPYARGGKVPRNEFGNVDLYVPSMLPGGTVHLSAREYPGIMRTANELKVDAAEAIVGFDFGARQGRAVPVKDGVVVCEEYVDVLRDVWQQHASVRAERRTKERERKVLKKWRRLVRRLLIRQEVIDRSKRRQDV